MTTFKPGDRIKVIQPYNLPTDLIGHIQLNDTGTVLGPGSFGHHYYFIKFDKYPDPFQYIHFRLELIGNSENAALCHRAHLAEQRGHLILE